MNKIFVLSNSFNAVELQTALQQEIKEESSVELELKKEVSKSLEAFVDPSVLMAILSSGGVVTIVTGLFSIWQKRLEKKTSIEIAKIKAEAQKEQAIELAKIQADAQKASALIKIKTVNGEIEIPSTLSLEERNALLQSLEKQNVKSIALITEL